MRICWFCLSLAALASCAPDDAKQAASFACSGNGYYADPIATAVDAAVSLAACFWEPDEPAPGSTLQPLPPRPGFIGKSNRTPVYKAPPSNAP